MAATRTPSTWVSAEDVTCTYVSRPEPTALDEIDEPELFNRMFLPLIGR